MACADLAAVAQAPAARLEAILNAPERYADPRLDEAMAWCYPDPEDARKFAEEFGFHRPKGGENFEDVKARTGPFLEELFELARKEGYDERPVAVVSHAMAIRSMISHLLGYGLNDIWHFDIQPTGILEIGYDIESKWGRVVSMTGPQSAI